MRLSRTLASASMIGVMGVLGLTSCSTETSTSPSGTSTPSSASSPTSPSGAVTVTAPAECDDVELAPAARVAGSSLAACVVGFSRAAGSGHEFLQSGDSSGEIDFVYGDQPEMTGVVTGTDGPTSFVFTRDESWITINGAWVRGDIASSDPAAVIAGTAAAAYRATADPSVAASMISSAPSWTVQTDQDVVALPTGEEVHAWRLQADAPFDALGTQVQQMIVWLTPTHAVVGNQATVTVGGVQTTTLQQYSDWGVPVVIEPPTP